MHRDGHFDYSLFLSRIICLPLTTSTLHNLVLALSFPPLANTRILSFPPDSIIRLSLSLHFFSYFFFILSFCPSLLPLPPLPFSIHRASLHRRLDRTDLLFTCARNNYIQPRFFCHEPRSYELARGGNELSYCKIVPGCNCKRVPGPATGFLNDRGSVLWSILKRRIVSRYIIVRDTKGFYLGKFYGEFPSWMVIINRLKRNNSFIFRWKTFEVLSLLV